MNLTKLPIFQAADQTLMQLQTKWAGILNPLIGGFNSYKSQTPTQQVFPAGKSGIYNTPDGVFYLNVIMAGGSTNSTTFGSSFLSASSAGTGVVIPGSPNLSAFFYPASRLDAIIKSPNTSYPYSVGDGSAYVLVREYYQ